MLRDLPRARKTVRSNHLQESSSGVKDWGKKKKTRGEDQEDRPNLLGKYHKEIMRSQEKQSSDVGNWILCQHFHKTCFPFYCQIKVCVARREDRRNEEEAFDWNWKRTIQPWALALGGVSLQSATSDFKPSKCQKIKESNGGTVSGVTLFHLVDTA